MYLPHKYFIFDLDGTLAYTIEDLCAAVNLTLKHFGWREITIEQTLQNINLGARIFVKGSMPEEFRGDEALVDRVYAKYSELYAEEYLKTTRLYPGVAEGIEYLVDKGAELAVFSNKQDIQTKKICEKLFPAGTFKIVLGHNGMFTHKPSPEGALYIAEILGAAPSDIAVVGDSDIDMKLATNAGMHPVGVSWGYRPDTLLSSLGAEMILVCAEDFKKLI